MKRFTVIGNLLKGVAFSALLFGCQNEEVGMQNTQHQSTINDQNAKTSFTPQLLKEGANELEYYGEYDTNRGKLKKITNKPEDAYIEYQYNGSNITAQRRKISTKALIYQVTYQLDNLGRCTESTSTETNKTLKYEYGQYDRLIKIYNKNTPSERMEFGYQQNAATMLSSINSFNQSNIATKEISYSYMVQGGNAMQNKYPTNPDAFGATGKYLRIFGVFHSNLPVYESTKNLPWNGEAFQGYSLSYVFNANGYAKAINAASNMSNLTITTSRTYSTPQL